jgi:uncharacterized protein
MDRQEVPFTSVSFSGGFLDDRLRTHRTALLPAAIRKCETTGRLDNFRNAALKINGQPHGEHVGIYFNDSDVYKVLEGMAYSLMRERDPALEAKAAEWMTLIGSAQEPDGYLDTYFTLKEPGNKWTNMERHEDYCAGHFFEAAVAYACATGDVRALSVARRLADHMLRTLKEAGRHWVIGHEETELALVKLYKATGHRPYLDLASWFIEQRGRGFGAGTIWDTPRWGPTYCQDDKPVRELERVTGHAVRAMYYYSGIADVAGETGDDGLSACLFRLWENVVGRNMYVTGGIGSSKSNEGFAGDWVLPNADAYCETCAGIGLAYWAHRMHLITGRSPYLDVFERVLYNNILAGLSLDGTRFFYVNPLESAGAHHREEWFDCCCCPTSLARFLPSLGGYLYCTDAGGLSVNHYAASSIRLDVNGTEVGITQRTGYPWDGLIEIGVECAIRSELEIRLRVPSWADSCAVTVNGRELDPETRDGFLALRRTWETGDRINVCFPMPVRTVAVDPRVEACRGRVAVQRGPVVYCAEQVDNEGAFPPRLPEEPLFVEREAEIRGCRMTALTALPGTGRGKSVRLVPYFAWDNRAAGGMTVWLESAGRPSPAMIHSYAPRSVW